MSVSIGPNSATPATTPVDRRPLTAGPPPTAAGDGHSDGYGGTVGEQPADARKHWRQLEWAAFGVEMVGGTLALLGSGSVGLTLGLVAAGPVGLALAAVGGAGIVFAGYERSHAGGH